MIGKEKVTNASVISEEEILIALKSVLASGQFIKAPRASRLLRFLVENTLSGSVREINEYAIGLDVFDRNPSTYSTTDDPIVRVQVGRLREKLKAYFSIEGSDTDIEISIPIGSYIPVIRRIRTAEISVKQFSKLAIHPLKCISQHGDGIPFTQGLDAELTHQLFKAFGQIIVPHSFFTFGDTNNENRTLKDVASAGVNHLLEGSVQIDAKRIRASVRLVDVSAGCIAWSEQFDRDADFAIKLQEELASSNVWRIEGISCHE